jgi:hypothetical protein
MQKNGRLTRDLIFNKMKRGVNKEEKRFSQLGRNRQKVDVE